MNAMDAFELTRLMHAVIDGEASPEERRMLDERLAVDSAARAEFESWRALVGGIEGLPMQPLPAGASERFAAAVAQALPKKVAEPVQPSGASSVLSSRFSRFVSQLQEEVQMVVNRKLGAAVVFSVVALGVASFVFDFPPKQQDITGTIAPAERYRAPQAGAEAVKLGDQTIAQLMQSDAFDKIVKDPELSAAAKDANFRALALVLSRNNDAAQRVMASMDASRMAADNVELAKMVMADARAARMLLEAVSADRKAAERKVAELMAEAKAANAVASIDYQAMERAIRAQTEAARVMLANPEASRAAMANVELARLMLANPEASRVLMSAVASARVASSADRAMMLQTLDANRAQLERVRY
jgi:hypothetical protein